jgi:hypothetical protein
MSTIVNAFLLFFTGYLTKTQTTGENVPGIIEQKGFTLLETTFLVVS